MIRNKIRSYSTCNAGDPSQSPVHRFLRRSEIDIATLTVAKF
jgi:hypothetical protein